MTRNQLAKEVAETTETVEAKGSEKTNELKVTDDLCATIADKEDEASLLDLLPPPSPLCFGVCSSSVGDTSSLFCFATSPSLLSSMVFLVMVLPVVVTHSK